MPQLFPPACMCPLLESINNYLKHIVFILKVPRGPRSRKELLPFLFLLCKMPKPPNWQPQKPETWLITLAVTAEPVHRLPGRRASVLVVSLVLLHKSTWRKAVCVTGTSENGIIKSPCTMWASERSCYCCMSKVQWYLLLLFVKSHSC